MKVTKKIPIKIWLVMILFLFVPLIFDMFFYKSFESAWLLQLISIYLIITYMSILGGILTCTISIAIHLFRTISENSTPEDWDSFDFEIFIMVTVIKVVFTIITINLMNKIHLKQTELQIINDELDSKSKELEEIAYQDSLTGLPNRYMLHEYLQKALFRCKREKKELAVIFLDLDRFKNINDLLGHHAGDFLLKKVSDRLLSIVRKRDMVARQGGDEFVIFLEDVKKEDVSQIAERILTSITAPFIVENEQFFLTTSIGISLFPTDGEDVETLIKKADIAMYAAKGKSNNFQYFSIKSEKINNRKIILENSLRNAINNNEFTLFYQPQVDLENGELIGMEALLRWKHPTLGYISPAEFIPIAEKTGLIIPIGNWVLETACKQNKIWQNSGYSLMRIAVNVSTYQFQNPPFIEDVQNILNETQIDPKYLELEITESIMEDVNEILPTINKLKKLGLTIAIDDFGTGYSSLSLLNRLPIDYLKIDQSFVRDLSKNLNNESIIKTIISMAHHLNLKVVAEGIETREQLVFLQQHLCDIGQGYLFSKPFSANEIDVILEDIQQIVKNQEIFQDKVERQRTEELLQMAKKEMQDTVRLHQGTILKYKKIDGKFIYTFCEGQLLYRFGMMPNKVVGKEITEFFPKRVAIEKINYYQMAWEGQENVTYEDEVNGIHYLATLRPIKRGGEVIEVIVSCIDITERIHVEEALRKSEKKYRLIAENSTDLIRVLDVNGILKYVSPSHKTVLGYPPNLYEGKDTFEKMHPEDAPLAREKFSKMYNTKLPCKIEYRLLDVNGDWKLIESFGTPVIGEEGEPEQFVVVGRDITEKRNAEELLLKKEKLSLVGELAAGVAHEIRNPLTSIKGFIQLFQKGIIDPKFFDIIFMEFDHIEKIINEFLTLAKPQEIQLKKTNMETILKNVKTLLESEAHLKNVQLTLVFQKNLPKISCDINQIKQVFINIIKNSIEAISDEGSVKVNVSIEDENVLIRVIDNGVGMSEERLKRLGEPFFSNKEKGTGLGLMLCFRIIDQHNGTISFKSKKNHGTTVEVRLPI